MGRAAGDFDVLATHPPEQKLGSVSQGEIEAALQRILASDPFVRSERLTRFLSYIVHKTLAGESSELKEYHLGMAVCGRKAGYDPRTDPVVRVEARRLRAALDLYYANEGRECQVQILLPRGGYIPHFEPRTIQGLAAPTEVEGSTAASHRQKRWIVVAALSAAIVVCVAGVLVGRHQFNGRVVGSDGTIVVAEFTNSTGEPIFDHALRQGLVAQLEQSPYLSLLPDTQVAQTMALMDKPVDSPFTVNVAREVCQRNGKSVVVDGSIAPLGNQYVLELNAIDCHTGAILAAEQMQADGKEQVLAALAKEASDLRKKLGESLASVQKYDAPPESVTTPSLEALQAYSLGFQVHVVKLDENGAAQLFQRAIAIDPNFAMAYARLAVCEINLGEVGAAAENLRKAYDLRSRVSEHEGLFILSLYHEFVTGDLDQARKTYELRAQIFPRDDIPIGNAGNVYFLLGQYDKALEATQEALKRNPGSRIWNGNLVNAYIALNRIPEAKAAAARATEQHLESPWLHICLYLIAYEENNPQAMAQESEKIHQEGEFEDILLYYQAQAKASEGKLQESRVLSQRAVDQALHEGQRDTAALYFAQAALNEAWAGNREQAMQLATKGLRLSASRESGAVAGIALAISGYGQEARHIADDLEQRFPNSTIVRNDYVPVIRAASALHANKNVEQPENIVEMLAPATQIELGSHTVERVGYLTCYPIYFRGEAYLAEHNATKAASEFQRILDHPQLTLTDPVRMAAAQGLAHANELSKNLARTAVLK